MNTTIYEYKYKDGELEARGLQAKETEKMYRIDEKGERFYPSGMMISKQSIDKIQFYTGGTFYLFSTINDKCYFADLMDKELLRRIESQKERLTRRINDYEKFRKSQSRYLNKKAPE